MHILYILDDYEIAFIFNVSCPVPFYETISMPSNWSDPLSSMENEPLLDYTLTTTLIAKIRLNA